jgi:hypothetical protein
MELIHSLLGTLVLILCILCKNKYRVHPFIWLRLVEFVFSLDKKDSWHFYAWISFRLTYEKCLLLSFICTYYRVSYPPCVCSLYTWCHICTKIYLPNLDLLLQEQNFSCIIIFQISHIFRRVRSRMLFTISLFLFKINYGVLLILIYLGPAHWEMY